MSTSDEEAEMAKMMGFSGFSSGSKPAPPGGNKKRKLNVSPSDDRTAAPRGIPLGNSKGPNANLIAVPATRAVPRQEAPSLDPAAGGSSGEGAPPAAAGQEARAEAESGGGGEREEDAVLEKPLERLTGQDLARLRFGIRQADGRTVFFLPSFLEDPWALKH
jgi:hypothetical protein